MGPARTAVVASLALGLSVSGVGFATANPMTAPGLDPYPVRSSAGCSSVTRPGTEALAQILRDAYPGVTANTAVRACSGDVYVSDHSRGLAIDWSVPAGSDRGEQFLAWLFEGDGAGQNHVRLRRLGVTEVIWNYKTWTSALDRTRTSSAIATWRDYDAGPCFAKYGSSTDCGHVGHMHIGLGDAGGSMSTSWWKPVMDGHRDSPDQETDWSSSGNLSLRRFADTPTDFDGDGQTDVFTVTADGQWWYSSGGAGSFVKLAKGSPGVGVDDLAIR